MGSTVAIDASYIEWWHHTRVLLNKDVSVPFTTSTVIISIITNDSQLEPEINVGHTTTLTVHTSHLDLFWLQTAVSRPPVVDLDLPVTLIQFPFPLVH